MSAPRNVCVVRAASIAAGTIALYQVPAGNQFILKDVRLQGPTGAANVTLFITGPAGNPTLAIAKVALAAGQAYGGWSGWLVINGGDFLAANFDVAGIGYWVSGAVLPFA